MGEVYRAEDLRLGQTVALKFLPRSLAQTDQALERFTREVRLARQVSHPNVCRVFDLGEISEVGADGKRTELTFLTMEFVDGEDLASLMRRIGRLPSDKALEIAQQLCAGLAAAHESGIVHRDLKPANIMLDGRGRVRITDFGLAGLIAEIEGANTRAGTPAYMSPEQFAGGEVSPKSDVYSLGLVLYEIFTGKRPFNASSIEEMARLREKNAPTAPSHHVKGLDPLIERVILRCLEKDSGKRPASALQVAATLPGGDPLAAAIATGETPSPDTVAAAGESVSMSLAASSALLAAILLGIGAAAFLARYSNVLSAIRGGKVPEALAERAQQVIARAGYSGENVADSASWLEGNYENLAKLPRGSPEGIRFVYRRSPQLMIPRDMLSEINSTDPSGDLPGMLRVALDARGRLREFRAVPDPAHEQSSPAPDWSGLLVEAGFPSAQTVAPDPDVLPTSPFDIRQDWQGSDEGQTFAITAASYKGKAVFFKAAPLTSKQRAQKRSAEGFSGIMFVLAVFVCGTGGCFLARRNLRRDRGDRRGAFRVAGFIFLAQILAWVPSAHFVPAPADEYVGFIGGVGNAMYVAGFMWILYLAVEPYVRRLWPEMLISWMRILSGSFRDSRVARDVLMGSVGGVAMALVLNGVNALPTWFSIPNVSPVVPSSLVLHGSAGMVAALGWHSSQAVQWALAVTSFLLIARVILRRDWLAAGMAGACLGMVVLPADNFLIAVPAAMVCSAIVYLILFRFGLLSVAVILFFYFVLRRWPITLDLSQWFIWRSVFSMVLLVAIAVAAFLAVNSGRIFSLGPTLED
jgi:serine/threonine-protein kinase